MYFHFSDPRPRRIIAVLMFFISSAQHGGMSVCHQVMMSGVKCHPHIRRTRGENNNPHQHYTQHENQGNLMVAATLRIHTTLAEAWSILCDGAVIDTDSALWFLKLVWDTGGNNGHYQCSLSRDKPIWYLQTFYPCYLSSNKPIWSSFVHML